MEGLLGESYRDDSDSFSPYVLLRLEPEHTEQDAELSSPHQNKNGTEKEGDEAPFVPNTDEYPSQLLAMLSSNDENDLDQQLDPPQKPQRQQIAVPASYLRRTQLQSSVKNIDAYSLDGTIEIPPSATKSTEESIARPLMQPSVPNHALSASQLGVMNAVHRYSPSSSLA